MMNAGLMTTGLTNGSTGGDPAVQSHLCATDAVEGAPNTVAVAETAASEPNVDPNAEPSSDSWRVEVATRLARYRTRRKPRTPRYPSLLLPFDAPESWSRLAPPSGSTASAAASLAEPRETLDQGPEEQRPYRYPEQVAEQSAKVIEFPRCAAMPVFHPGDLADPVFDRDRPRIVEVAEILPPPPALGGMLMEPAQPEPARPRDREDFPVP